MKGSTPPRASKTRRPHAGFTFIEVLVAMAIFTMAVLAAINITSGSVGATRDAREVSEATWLLQQKMVELETKLETDGIEKACEKKDEGKFEAPHEKYSWKSSCDEVDFQISETASKMTQAEGEEEDKSSKENQLLKFILKTASDYITQSLREVHVEVDWVSGKNKRSVDATTHFVRYDQKVSLGGLGGGGTDTSKGTETTPGDTTQ
jgi:type II secretion system protein I